MPKKKSIKKAVQRFLPNVEETKAYVAAASQRLSAAHRSRVYDGAIIALYRDFENLILEVLVGAINNDTTTISSQLGVAFPRHLTDEVCRYIITGPSYFDFKGREGLISRVKQYVPKDHYLVEVLKEQRHKTPLEQLVALRNFAAHSSPQSRKAALEATEQKQMATAGSWLKCQGRFARIADQIESIARDIENSAPY
jgi:hypothetical protein